MKFISIYGCFLLFLFLSYVHCAKKREDVSISTKIKRHIDNYHYYQSQLQYDLKGCGYLTELKNYDFEQKSDENFVNYQFPVTEKIIYITKAELDEVTAMATQILEGKCSKENILLNLGLGQSIENCIPNENITIASKNTNLLEIVLELLSHRYYVSRLDVVEFKLADSEPLPSDLCVPVNSSQGISELDRMLTPYCVLDDSRALQSLPTARSLSLLFEEQNSYEGYRTSFSLNHFGYFLFQAFSQDVQKLANKTASGSNCNSFTGCQEDGKIAVWENLRTDSVDVLNVCPADPFYSIFGTTCLTYRKLQTLNSDCEIRKRNPLNRASPFLDLSHIYEGVKTAVNGTFPKNGVLPDLKNDRACFSTPLQAINILKVRSHDAIAEMIKARNESLSDERIFKFSKKLNIFIFQRVLYEHLLPVLLGSEATNQYDLSATKKCYDPSRILHVPVETIVAAMRYCHAYIPAEYHFYASNYEFFDKRSLDKGLSPEALDQFYKHLIRGLISKKLLKEKSKCAHANSHSPKHTIDIRALDVETGRDTCIAPFFAYFSAVYNVSPYEDWDYYENFFSTSQIDMLSRLYKSPQDLELTVGGAFDLHEDSIFGNLFKTFISNFFLDLKCNDPNFWSNKLTGITRETMFKLDVQDWIACAVGLKKRPKNLFCPYNAENLLVDVTCKSREDLKALLEKKK